MNTAFRFNLNSTKHRYRASFLSLLFLFTLAGLFNTVSAREYTLAIQPILSKQKTISFYQPLAAFLSRVTGHKITIHASYNFVSYWEELRTNQKYDLALDAAHFTNYRVKNLKYTVLAKITDTVSYSLIANEDATYFDADELIGQRIASLASPSIGGVRLLSMFPNTSRQPVFVGTNNFQETLKKLKDNSVAAALVPTPLISGDNSVNTIMVTDPIPHMALSASQRVDKKTKDKIRAALIKANATDEGKALFATLNLAGFEKANNLVYDGYDSLLKDVWGYGF